MEFAFLNHNGFVSQLNRYYLAQFDDLRPSFLFQIGGYSFFLQLSVRALSQHFREFFDLIIRQTNTAVRRERADFRQ